jgi:hypothetical protein
MSKRQDISGSKASPFATATDSTVVFQSLISQGERLIFVSGGDAVRAAESNRISFELRDR